MIDFYTWPSPNDLKVRLMLEESGLEYQMRPVDLSKGEQLTPEFKAVNPNAKIPALVDSDGPGGRAVTVFESGAILLYLAEKSGRFLPPEAADRWQVISWLMFQMAGLGPMLAQAGYFINRAPEPVPPAIERYGHEAKRHFQVVEDRLGEADYLAGDYSVADMACFPWLRIHGRFGLEISEFPNIARWLEVINGRPAIQRALELP